MRVLSSTNTQWRKAHGILSVGILIALAGCKADPAREILERELRLQEDRIYSLEETLDERCDALEAARRENSLLKKEIDGSPSTPSTPKSPTGIYQPPTGIPSTPPKAAPTPPQLEIPGLNDSAPSTNGTRTPDLDTPPPGDTAPTFAPPTVETEAPPADRFPQPEAEMLPEPTTAPPRVVEDPAITMPEGTKPSIEVPTTAPLQLNDDASRITKIFINKQLTGGLNNDRKSGDEGISVVFEPRDLNNKLVEAVGDLSIVVVDATQSGAQMKVARWDFTADEAAKYFKKGPIATGVQLELPWSSTPPKNSKLEVFIRLTTPSGRKIEASQRITIKPSLDQEARRGAPRPQWAPMR